MKVSKYTEKLNKIPGVTYSIEEEISVVNGVYEGELQHDNVTKSSLNIYTGSKLTGSKIDTYILSTPSKTPWKNTIKIFSNAPIVYISYETIGDTIEAFDINKVQEEIIITQTEILEYEEYGIIDGGTF